MSHDLFAQYVEVGIIQFGRFQQVDGSIQPIAFNFLLLPSFPALMQATARALTPMLLATETNRLLTTRATMPLGAVLAVESGIAMTYPYGEAKAYTSAFVIEGAYDVGHPTALLTYTLASEQDAQTLLEPARQVGLHVKHVLCLAAINRQAVDDLTQQAISVKVLLSDLEGSLAALAAEGKLTATLRDHVTAWLKT